MKNFILWSYERGAWQYDVFCLLIIAFIFLTPKTWFEKREKLATQTARLAVKAEGFSVGRDAFENQFGDSGGKRAEILNLITREEVLGKRTKNKL